MVLDGQPLSDVVLTVSSTDPDETTVTPATLTFTTTNWGTPQTVTVTGIADDAIDGDQSTDITVSVNDAASDDAFDSLSDQTVTVTTSDIDNIPQNPGNVDGDGDFDANDSFLIHLVKLSGTDAQIDQSKGSSPLTAAQIRAAINQLGSTGDVDGDQDVDANDSFLIHLVKLSGTNAQIDQSKGSSPLSAAQIRTNINGLGSGAATTSKVEQGPQVLQSVLADVSDTDTSDAINTNLSNSPALLPNVSERNLFPIVGPDEQSASTLPVDVVSPDSSSEFTGEEFRQWIDAI